MNFVDSAVVLSRRPVREYDRLAVLYTRSHGRLSARFVGVNRARGKLKPLCEPMVHAEFRIWRRTIGAPATVTGGRLLETYPRLRGDLGRLSTGLWMCELLARLTPEGAPSELKYELVTSFLTALDERPSPWLCAAFGLRLLRLAGYAQPQGGLAEGLWERLLEEDPGRLDSIAEDGPARRRLECSVEHAAEGLIEGPLRTRAFREALQSVPLTRSSPVGGLAA